MKRKSDRLQTIKRIITTKNIGSQDELLRELAIEGYQLTQATLSRDLKQMQIAKVANKEGGYSYIMSQVAPVSLSKKRASGEVIPSLLEGMGSIEFSGNMAVIKTRPGHAGSIAYEIDNSSIYEILGTVAGDDTILLVMREGASRDVVLERLGEKRS